MTSCESILSSLNDDDHMLLMIWTTGGQKDQFQRDASHQCIGTQQLQRFGYHWSAQGRDLGWWCNLHPSTSTNFRHWRSKPSEEVGCCSSGGESQSWSKFHWSPHFEFRSLGCMTGAQGKRVVTSWHRKDQDFLCLTEVFGHLKRNLCTWAIRCRQTQPRRLRLRVKASLWKKLIVCSVGKVLNLWFLQFGGKH